MKFSKEARIGLLVAVSVVVLFLGFYFLKGANVFSKNYEYYAYYSNVQGLQLSAAVQIKGLQVGKVTEIHISGDSVQVTMTINKKIRLPVGTIAKLTSIDLLGTKGISMDLGTSLDYVDNQTLLHSQVEGGLIDKISVEITPLLQDVRKVVNNVDSVLTAVNDIFSEQAKEDLQKSVASLHVAMMNFQGVSGKLNRQSDALAHVIQNADKITTNLANNNANIDQTLKNLRTTTDNLSRAPIEQTIKNLDEVSNKLNGVLTKIDNNEGSLGLLVNDKQLYNNLTKTLEELANLSADLKSHPSKYINLTIFGRKAKVGN